MSGRPPPRLRRSFDGLRDVRLDVGAPEVDGDRMAKWHTGLGLPTAAAAVFRGWAAPVA